MPTDDSCFIHLTRVVIFEVVIPDSHKSSYLAEKEKKKKKRCPSQNFKIRQRQRDDQNSFDSINF